MSFEAFGLGEIYQKNQFFLVGWEGLQDPFIQCVPFQKTANICPFFSSPIVI